MENVKLTKKVVNEFITWSTSRYNNYLCFGTKKQNVDTVYNSLVNGYYTDERGKEDTTKTFFEIECSGGNGEGYGNRYWRLKGRSSDYKYLIDCVQKTIVGLPSNKTLQFIKDIKEDANNKS